MSDFGASRMAAVNLNWAQSKLHFRVTTAQRANPFLLRIHHHQRRQLATSLPKWLPKEEMRQ